MSSARRRHGSLGNALALVLLVLAACKHPSDKPKSASGDPRVERVERDRYLGPVLAELHAGHDGDADAKRLVRVLDKVEVSTLLASYVTAHKAMTELESDAQAPRLWRAEVKMVVALAGISLVRRGIRLSP